MYDGLVEIVQTWAELPLEGAARFPFAYGNALAWEPGHKQHSRLANDEWLAEEKRWCVRFWEARRFDANAETVGRIRDERYRR